MFQVACMVFFLLDLRDDLGGAGLSGLFNPHVAPEIGATIAMMLGLAFEGRYLMRLLRRQAHLEHGLGVAAGELSLLMEDYFRKWGLTASEQDIATFTIKGYSIAEIAVMRGSAEATVKTHLNAIYRKSGVAGRGQLVSILIEDLMRAPLIGDVRRAPVPSAA
jgi:DNA-binding CsgD family transcriptional regulator